ncbi:DUF3331 domain-containing protein [Paraburkholderia phytofirmans]|uniref:DUF3331 domain-containing protein n=1 Tax=Paraburkholderia phytofirmans TaxID=261302 RepID=UPI0038B7E5AF
MDQVFERVDAWQGILRQLRAMTGDLRDEFRKADNAGFRPAPSGSRVEEPNFAARSEAAQTGQSASVRIVEWSDKNLTIVWHDPTACSYDDQRWRRAKSSRAGVCALTGMVIHKGQEIFKPGRTKPPPANADAMILVSALPVALTAPWPFERMNNEIAWLPHNALTSKVPDAR